MARAETPFANSPKSARNERGYSYIHVVSFEETNVVGNVYFARHIAWQGRCRELFLKEHAPQIINEMSKGLRLVTLKTSCEYFEEIKPLEKIEVLMRLSHIRQNRISLDFEYRRIHDDTLTVVALGNQAVSFMHAAGKQLIAVTPPDSLLSALRPYQRPNAVNPQK